MTRIILSTLFTFLFYSCASIFNKPHKTVTIHTKYPATIYHEKDSIKTLNNIVSINAKRQKSPLKFIVNQDTFSQEFSVQQKISFTFWTNLLFKFGIGMLIDLTNSKMLTYPSHIYIDSTETNKGYYTYERFIPKEKWEYHIHLPFLSLLNHQDYYGFNTLDAGFFGIGVGVNYYHKNNGYLNFSAQTFLQDNYPLPPPLNLLTEKHTKNYFHLFSLSNNHRFKRFNVGYGLSFSHHFQQFELMVRSYDELIEDTELNAKSSLNPSRVNKISRDIDPGIYETQNRNIQQIGLLIPVSYEITKKFNLSFQYKPSLFQIKGDQPMNYNGFYTWGVIYKIER